MKTVLLFIAFMICLPCTQLNAQEVPLLRGEIQDHKNGAVSVNIGAQQGVTSGMIFNAYGDDNVLTIPLTDEVVIKRGKVIGRLRVVHVAPRFCRCEMVEPFILRLGMVVIGRPVREIGNRPPIIDTVTWDAAEPMWGRPFKLQVEARDPESRPLQLSGNCDLGRLTPVNSRDIFWFPPQDKGRAKLVLSVSDGIGRDKKQLEFNFKAVAEPKFDPVSWDRLLGGSIPINQIDQIQTSADGLLWLLDRSQQRIICLNHSLKVLQTIDLEGTTPLRFSVSQQRVVVLDDRSERVLVYSRTGKPQARIGGSGSDIHEWEEAIDVILLEDDSIAVLDGEQQTVLLYDSNGLFRACVGHPGNKPPGLLKGRWLTSHGKRGFSVTDVDQHSRLLFNMDLKFVESRALGDVLLPVGGPDGIEPTRWPPGLNRSNLTALAALPGNRWAASDRKGHRLWRWNNNPSQDRYVDLNHDLEGARLRQQPDHSMQLLFSNHNHLVTVDNSGWLKDDKVPSDLKRATDYLPGSREIWLDGETRRLRVDQVRFGQKGSGTGMLDEPVALISWDNALTVLDRENEKVVLFSLTGKFLREHEFENCRAFCQDSKGHLIIQGKGGHYWRWPSDGSAPQALSGPEGNGFVRLTGGFAIFGKKHLTICNDKFEPLQQLPFKEVQDVKEAEDGMLWVLRETELLRLIRAR